MHTQKDKAVTGASGEDTGGKNGRTGTAVVPPGAAKLNVTDSGERFSLVNRAMARAVIANMQ